MRGIYMPLNGGISVNRRLVGWRESNGRWLSKSERNCGSIVSYESHLGLALLIHQTPHYINTTRSPS
jgi:hypothetical protein